MVFPARLPGLESGISAVNIKHATPPEMVILCGGSSR